MLEELFEDVRFDESTYDLDGIVGFADREEAAFVFMYMDDDKYYRNRYDILECDRGMDYMLGRIHYYLEQDDQNALFISFAAAYEGRLILFNGQGQVRNNIDLGDVELGSNMIYGMTVRLCDGEYVFKEVLYMDGGLNDQSTAEELLNAGELSVKLKAFIEQFE